VRCLITGIGGFLGGHLAESLAAASWEVHGVSRTVPPHLEALGVSCHRSDIRNADEIRSLLSSVRPDVVCHMAAQSSPGVSWSAPATTFEVNVIGSINLLEGVRGAQLDPVILSFGSSAEYSSSSGPISEDHPRAGFTPYAVSKVAQDQLGLLYNKVYGTRVIRVRPFYIVGPRKTGDVTSDIARGVVAVERGERESVESGNLDVVRDLLDVADAVSAIRMIAANGAPGEAYNVSSGQGYPLRALVTRFSQLATKPITVHTEARLIRPFDDPVRIGDNTKLRSLGWAPEVDLDVSLAAVLEYWRLQPARGGGQPPC
jgi:GDP-4-dehydro-6-deoxy-D-mannose reductase